MSQKITSKIGAHVSIAGGIDKAPVRAFELGCETFQCFTRPPQGGPASLLTSQLLANFKSEMKRCGFENFYIHTPYYLNYASVEPRIRESSIRVTREELERGSQLSAKYVMTHLGSHSGRTLDEGIKGVTGAVDKILKDYNGETELLLEISAGTENIIGDTFDEIGTVVKHFVSRKGFGGVCFDTCHAFASGYDFRTKESAKKMLAEFDKKIGLKWLKLVHVNDSKVDLGGKRDRHEHIGDGFIGKEGMTTLLHTLEFSKIDWILETNEINREKDIEILKKIRS